MFGQLDELFYLAKQRIDYYESILKEVETNPKKILSEIYIENTPDSLLSFLVNDLGESYLVEFQTYLYRLLIPYLKSTINIDGVEFFFSTQFYPSPLTILFNDVPLAEINIYEKILMLRENEKVRDINVKIKDLEYQRKLVQIELDELELSRVNPLTIGGSNPLKLANIAIRKKSFIKDIECKICEVGDKLSQIQRDLNSLNLSLENTKQDFIEAEYFQERLQRKFQNYFNYQIDFEVDKVDVVDIIQEPIDEQIETNDTDFKYGELSTLIN